MISNILYVKTDFSEVFINYIHNMYGMYIYLNYIVDESKRGGVDAH